MAQSIKLSDDLMCEVRREAKLHGRSLAAHVTHWARIGKAIERSGFFTHDQITELLVEDARFTYLGDTE